jgi:hypothetical protein
VLAEQFTDFVFGRREGQVANVEFLQNLVSRCRCSGLTKRSGSAAISAKSPTLQNSPES